MPRYLVERSHPPLTEEEWAAAAQQSKAIIEQNGLEITWVKSYYSTEEGKCYCEYEAPSADVIYEYARLAQSPPIDKISPIDIVVDPGMFR